MNSLSNGFLYIIGLSWLLCEVCLSASGGNWTPLWVYLAGFVLMFAILGCLPISARAVDALGPVFAILIGAGLLTYGVDAFGASLLGGVLRSVGGVALVALGVFSYAGRKSTEAH